MTTTRVLLSKLENIYRKLSGFDRVLIKKIQSSSCLTKQKNLPGSNRRASKKAKRLAEAQLDQSLSIVENVNEINVSIEHYVLFHQPVQNKTRVKTRNLN